MNKSLLGCGRATIPPGEGRCSEGAGRDSLVAPCPVPERASLSTPARSPAHYTHAEHAARAVAAGLRGEVLTQFVQVKFHPGDDPRCAQILRGWLTHDGWGMWKLKVAQPSGAVTEASVPVFKTRQCSGIDGFCVCAGESGPVGKPQAPTGPDSRSLGCAGLVTPHKRLTGELSTDNGTMAERGDFAR